MHSVSWLYPDWYRIVVGGSLRRQTTKMGSKDWFGWVFKLECSAGFCFCFCLCFCFLFCFVLVCFFANGKWDASGPWHAVATWLVKLSPVVRHGQVPTEDTSWGPKWLLHIIILVVMMTIGTVVWEGSSEHNWAITQRKWQTLVLSPSAQVYWRSRRP